MPNERANEAEDAENNESPSSKFDVQDMPSKEANVSNFDIIFLVISIVTHITDLLFDINVAWHYLSNGQNWHFTSTILVILIPSLINNAVSFRMRQQDRELNSESPESQKRGLIFRTVKNIFSVILQIAPLRRYCTSLTYALKSRKCKAMDDKAGQRQYYLKMVKENQDIALITVFECFLETAPQQVIQSTIVLMNYNDIVIHQVLSIVSSFISMGWAMASYNRSIRLAQDDKSNIGSMGSTLQFLWHLLITVSRIVTLAVSLMLSVVGTVLFLAIHWITMTGWITTESHGTAEFCRNRRRVPHLPLTLKERFTSTVFACMLGIVYIFVYVNPDDNSTFMRHFIYYSLCLIENLIVVALFIFAKTLYLDFPCQFGNFCYSCQLPIYCLVPFVLGVGIMIVYYLYFHPSKRQRILNLS